MNSKFEKLNSFITIKNTEPGKYFPIQKAPGTNSFIGKFYKKKRKFQSSRIQEKRDGHYAMNTGGLK